MSDENLARSQNKKLINFWCLLVIYWFLVIYLILLIFISLLASITAREFVWHLFYNFLQTIWIPYISFFLIKSIRNWRLQRKNVKWPLFVVMFILPLFIFFWLWNFYSLGIDLTVCALNNASGRPYGCLGWRFDLAITPLFQIALSFGNAIFFTFKKSYWIWLNTFFALIGVAISYNILPVFDNLKPLTSLILSGYLLAISGLIDLIFYLFYNFKKENSDLKEVKS